MRVSLKLSLILIINAEVIVGDCRCVVDNLVLGSLMSESSTATESSLLLDGPSNEGSFGSDSTVGAAFGSFNLLLLLGLLLCLDI